MSRIISWFLTPLFCLTSLVWFAPFQLADYEQWMPGYQTDLVLGETATSRDAKKKAEAVLLEIYGKDILQQKPFHVYFDKENDTWLVVGNWFAYSYRNSPFPRLITWLSMSGGVAYIIIRKSDGKVLAVWHTK